MGSLLSLHQAGVLTVALMGTSTAGILYALSAMCSSLACVPSSFFLFCFLLILFLEHLQRKLIKRVPLLTNTLLLSLQGCEQLPAGPRLTGLVRGLCA